MINYVANKAFNESPDGARVVFTLAGGTSIYKIISLIMSNTIELYEGTDFTVTDAALGQITFTEAPDADRTFATDLLTMDDEGVATSSTCDGFVRLTEAKSWLNESTSNNDVALLSYICITANYIERYIQRAIRQVVITDEVIRTDGYTNEFNLREWPIVTSESYSVTYDGDAYTETEDYELDPVAGVLYFYRRQPRAFNKLKASYTAGYLIDDIPQELKGIALDGIKYMYRVNGSISRGDLSKGDIKSKKIDDFSVSYEKTPELSILNTGRMDVMALPFIVNNLAILDTYKRPII